MPSLRERLASNLLLPRRIQRRIPCERHGDDYGGWVIAPPVQGVVYSFGVGENITFEQSLAAAYDVTIFAFDPTPRSIEWVKHQALPQQFYFLEYGAAEYDGMARFHLPENPSYVSHSVVRDTQRGSIDVPVKRLQTIMNELGHSEVEVMKFDIEGAEYAVLEDMVGSGIRPRQLLVEFHHRFPEVGMRQTRRAVRRLNEYGYRIFSISSSCEEYSFVRE